MKEDVRAKNLLGHEFDVRTVATAYEGKLQRIQPHGEYGIRHFLHKHEKVHTLDLNEKNAIIYHVQCRDSGQEVTFILRKSVFMFFS